MQKCVCITEGAHGSAYGGLCRQVVLLQWCVLFVHITNVAMCLYVYLQYTHIQIIVWYGMCIYCTHTNFFLFFISEASLL